MKLNRKLIAACIAAACMFPASAATVSRTLTFDLSGFEIESVEEGGAVYSRMRLPDATCDGLPGHPLLPLEYVRFAVPADASAVSVSVSSGTDAVTMPLEYLPIPAQLPVRAGGEAESFETPDIDAYISSSLSASAFVAGDVKAVDSRIITVGVRPVSYDFMSSSVTAVGTLTVTLEYESTSGMDAAAVSGMDDIAERMRRRINPDRAAARIQQGKYIIVTIDRLVESFGRLAEWKRNKGYEVKVVSVESIVADPDFAPTGVSPLEDDAAAVREFLKHEYSECGGDMFCLLAGNRRDGFPIRWMRDSYQCKWLDKDEPYYNEHQGEAFAPSDNYFGDLKSVWPLQWNEKAGIFTCVDTDVPVDLTIPVGRIMPVSAGEVEAFTEKVILYEGNPGYGDNSYLDNILFVQQARMVGEHDIALATTDHFPNRKVMRDASYDDELVRWPEGYVVIDEIPSHGFISWHCHGNPGNMATSGLDYGAQKSKNWKFVTSLDEYGHAECWANSEVENGFDNIENPIHPVVSYAVSCDVNPFDCLTGDNGFMYDLKYNLGESFTLGKRYGGPAFVGNTRAGWETISARLEKLFMESLNVSRKIGYAEMLSKNLFPISYKERDTHVKYCHSVIGDPELEVWVKRPQNLDARLSMSGSRLSVVGNVPEGTVLSVSDNTASNVYSLSGGDNTVNFPINAESLAVCSIWSTGYLPKVTLVGGNGILINSVKTYLVTDAVLGIDKGWKVGYGGTLALRALNCVECPKLTVGANGSVDFIVRENVTFENTVIDKGGVVRMECGTVTFQPGFTMNQGAVLEMKVSADVDPLAE